VLPQHPVYLTWSPVWQKLLDVYEGAGGFLDEARPYLYAHPREWLDHSIKVNLDGDDVGKVRWDANPNPTRPSPKLRTRRKLARYENVGATLLDQVRAALFRKGADRSFADPEKIDDDHPLRQFWENADGCGRSIDAFMQEAWTVAAVFGHCILYADRDGETPEHETPSQADTPPVMLRGYTPLDMPDWLTDSAGRLTAVKLLEAAPRNDFSDVTTSIGYQVRTITDTTWSVEVVQNKAKQPKGEQAEPTQEDHGFGALPVVVLYARRRALVPLVGRSVLGDPQLYIDLYNLISEVRELLRNQTFAILNIPIGDANLATAQELTGQTTGTGNVLFSVEAANFISPQDTNVAAYHEHIDRLIRTIYRLATVAWESDSRDAEAADSRKLKKEDLHQMLAGYAAECEDTEIQIAKLVYRAHFGEQWQTQWDKDQPSISYPDDFDVESLTEMLENATAAQALELGETATKELKKRVATHLLPGLSQPLAQKIEEEIEALEVKTAAEQEMELMQARFGGMPPQNMPLQEAGE
jgi:hypothetical protein